MKSCLVGTIALVLLAAPGPAVAQEPPPCRITTHGDPGEAYGRMGQLAQPVAKELETWLGEQFAVFWLQSREFRWYVGIAPGPITPEQLRERALELVDARYDGADEAMLRENLGISEQPYGEPELRRIQEELSAKAVETLRVGWGNGVGCQASDAWRVEFDLFSDATPADVEEARRLAEPYGDRVRVVHHPEGGPPRPNALMAPVPLPSVAQLVRAGRCKVVVRRSARAQVRSLKVRRTGRRTASVRIRLKDGRNVRGTVRLRSCARS